MSIEERLDRVDARLNRVETRLDGVDKRIDAFEQRVEERFDHVDARFDQVDRRFEELDAKIERVGVLGEQDSSRIALLFEAVDTMRQRMERFEAKVDANFERLTDFVRRVADDHEVRLRDAEEHTGLR